MLRQNLPSYKLVLFSISRRFTLDVAEFLIYIIHFDVRPPFLVRISFQHHFLFPLY